jgi:uncharacterized membrane protein YfcA
MKESIATSLFIIFLFGIFGLVSYEIQGRNIDISISSLFVVGGAAGGILGATIAKRTNQNKLRKVFALFIILVGLAVFIQNLLQII